MPDKDVLVKAPLDIAVMLQKAWNSRALKVDWPGLEDVQRLILRYYQAGMFTAHEALSLLDDSVAAFTKRGNELREEPCRAPRL